MEKVRKAKKLVICLCVSALMTILCAAALMTELALPAEALTSNDVVYYGNYPQSGTTLDSKEPILWRVLEASGDRALMLSEKIIDAGVPFNPVKGTEEHYYYVWWSESPIRLFLNGESVYEPSVSADKTEKVTNPKTYNFYDTAFSTEEGNAIIKDTVDNSVKRNYLEYDKDKPISGYNFPPSPDTEDKIFILSYAEVDDDPNDEHPDKALGKKYGFDGKDSRRAKLTDYAKAENGDSISRWWIRSSLVNVYSSSYVYDNGSLGVVATNFETVGLRPAFRLNLKSLFFTSPAMGGKQTDVTDTLQEQKYDNDENVYEHTFTGRKFTTHKLTLATSKYKLDDATLTSGDLTLSRDVKIEVTYSGASTGTGYHLAAVVTSGDKALYYGRIKALGTEAEADGTAEFTIPKLNKGEDVYVFVEGKEDDDSSDRNKLTDFVSVPKLLKGEGRVIVETPMLESITINPLELTITEESNYQLKVTFAPEDVEEKEKEIEWSSSNPTVATVSTDGLVSALKAGTTTIKATAKLSGKVATHAVTVIEKPLEPGLILTPTAMTISKGVNADISVTFKDIDKQPLTWKSSDEKIATVDENGTVTAISEGECEITVTTADGTDAICEVTVVQGSQTEDQPYKKGGSSGCNAGIPAVVTLLTLGSLIYIRNRNGK
ncbi:Ig-like domain-containing protein [Cloacibacillus porcorum]|uniref:Ig-like domain-containing protein n=1 Tax=Cloacibacillus porcorum TaxID=1197717 RepID=UPI002673830B|nr:Ig-like domain-containing protein [Cloacibacillus porcorum]